MNLIRFSLALLLFLAVFSDGSTFAGEKNPEPTFPLVTTVGAFGSAEKSEGNDFVATFYDFTRDRRDRRLPFSPESYSQVLMDFFRSGLKTSKFTRFYRSPVKLHTSTIMVSSVRPSGPGNAFAEPDVQYCWAMLYKGKLVHKEAITFRFWGVGDDFMLVQVDGQIVLNACRREGSHSLHRDFSSLWESRFSDSGKYDLGNGKAVAGDWITLEPGVPLDMGVMTGNAMGGPFSAMLLVEVEGVEYEKTSQGGPVLPVFKTANLSFDIQGSICKGLVSGRVSVTNGPVFSVAEDPRAPTQTEGGAELFVAEVSGGSGGLGMRSWTADNGQTLEAKFVNFIGENVILEDSNGKQRRIPLNRFSVDDRDYIELAHLLKFEVNFIWESIEQNEKELGDRSWMVEDNNLPDFYEHVFRIELKQTSSKNCNRDLQIEFYVIADERKGNKAFLLDRQQASFVPSKSYAQAFSTKTVSIPTDDLYDDARDEDSFGYLVVLSDKRGRVVQHATSDEWLFNKLGNLRRIPVGAYMDKTCTRTLPSGLSPRKY
ncbi:MAG: hypothetical protein DRP64_21080 [Verrucomicrobia bacterium]|nr:MAG: hypothetical protein DRP64_21080 [Verrucomicrobiota bacterium]